MFAGLAVALWNTPLLASAASAAAEAHDQHDDPYRDLESSDIIYVKQLAKSGVYQKIPRHDGMKLAEQLNTNLKDPVLWERIPGQDPKEVDFPKTEIPKEVLTAVVGRKSGWNLVDVWNAKWLPHAIHSKENEVHLIEYRNGPIAVWFVLRMPAGFVKWMAGTKMSLEFVSTNNGEWWGGPWAYQDALSSLIDYKEKNEMQARIRQSHRQSERINVDNQRLKDYVRLLTAETLAVGQLSTQLYKDRVEQETNQLRRQHTDELSANRVHLEHAKAQKTEADGLVFSLRKQAISVCCLLAL